MPAALVGLVLAALLASTMGMTVSDINALTAVVQRDILPVMNKKFRDIKNDTGRKSLLIARLCNYSHLGKLCKANKYFTDLTAA